MIIRKLIIASLLLGCTTLLSASQEEAKALTTEKCAECHMIDSMTDTKGANGHIKAPPMWGVMRKIHENFKSKDEVVAFLIDYTMNPASEKMLFPKATEEYFGLMPSQKGKLTEEELSLIAEYLYK